MLELAGKKFKVATINRFKNLKENIVIMNGKKGKKQKMETIKMNILEPKGTHVE